MNILLITKKTTGYTRRILMVSFILAVACSLSSGQANDEAVVKAAAASFLQENVLTESKSDKTTELDRVYKTRDIDKTTVYIYQNRKGGFILMASNNNDIRVLGYVTEGTFTTENIPPQLEALIGTYEKYESLPKPQAGSHSKSTLSVSPLLDRENVMLNQYYHPEAGNCPTGCTATAMTQIMAYYKSPASGIESKCYNNPQYGTLCADIENTVFDWNNMSDEDYKLLSFQVAIAMEMDFCGFRGTGSIPLSQSYDKVLQEYYGYYVYNGSTDLYFLTNELDNERPAYAAIPGDPGHAVVIDGYDINGYYHINFGWGGRFNGYFLLNNTDFIDLGGNAARFGSNLAMARYISKVPLFTNTEDSLALVAIHNSFNGTTGWDLNTHCASWPGVAVMNGRVVELNLSDLSGSISDQVGKLTSLRVLSLSGNIDGALPASVSSLTKLKDLTISSNEGSLEITLPQELGSLTDLEYLIINGSPSGSIPPALGNLTRLKYLVLQSGSLTGSIPSELGNLTSLITLSLSKNKLTGNIPSSLCNLTSLQSIDLSHNQLTGSIPEQTGNMTKTGYILLNDNLLTGAIPASLGNCSETVILNLSNNSLEGPVPATIGNMKDLEYLELGHNSLTSLPTETGRLTNLKTLNIEDNLITAIPDSIGNIRQVINFKAGKNKIESIPPDFGSWPELQEIDMSYNNLTVFPEELCLLTRLWKIYFNNNKIEELPASFDLLISGQDIRLDSNRLRGPLPEYHLTEKVGNIDLRHNQFTYKDIPVSGKLIRGVLNQDLIAFNKNPLKADKGDTLKIDIRELCDIDHPGNAYYWLEYPEKIRAEYHEEMDGYTENPVLTIVVDESTPDKKYYCKVFNDNVSTFSWEWQGSTYTTPALRFLNTDTLKIEFLTDEEKLLESYPESLILSSGDLDKGSITNNNVTLVSPFGLRGDIIWQESNDSLEWRDIRADNLNEGSGNIHSVSGGELIVNPSSPAFYRCTLKEGNCDPVISDAVKIYPLGQVLYDGFVNVSTDTVTVAADSIEVTIPAGLSDKDFRLTIIKVDNPPGSPEGKRLGSVYDVTVSLGTVFSNPLLIKLKNFHFDISAGGLLKVPAFKPVYYDEKAQQWTEYSSGGISLQDSVIEFFTGHLTKLSWWQINEGSYTHKFTKGKATVVYKWGTNTGEENSYLGYQYSLDGFPSEPWHNTNTDPDQGGTPAVVQDIAEYMDQIITRFETLGMQPAGSVFTVYLSNTGSGSLGHINVGGYGLGYFILNSQLAVDRDDVRRTLAHEYMHYTQSRYMDVMTSNYFWAEACAPLADKIVWPADEIEGAEPESHLIQALRASEGNKSIYDLLGESWDASTSLSIAEKILVNPSDANVASSFLHYMRSYRPGAKLDPVKLLKNQMSLAGLTSITWRSYLAGQVSEMLESGVGDEFAGYVKYILSGTNSDFSILNRKGNLLGNIIKNSGTDNNGTFAKRETFYFGQDDDTPVNKNVTIEVPYLAAKVLILNNNTPDRPVVVNFKRLHDADADRKVFYGRYDLSNEEFTFNEISDSASYSLLLDSRAEKAVREYQNISFLLFVNGKCPDVISYDNDFDVSYELRAFPVVNINDLSYANVSDAAIHNYTDDTKKSFLMTGLMDMTVPGFVSEYRLDGYTREKKMINDSAFAVKTSFTQELFIDNGADLPSSTNRYEIQQIIEYNFISGDINITQISNNTAIWGAYYTAITDTYHPEIIKKNILSTQKIKFKGVVSLIPQTYDRVGEVMEFVTSSTEETQATVAGIEETTTFSENDQAGNPISSGTYSYVSTDYSFPDIKITLWLHHK